MPIAKAQRACSTISSHRLGHLGCLFALGSLLVVATACGGKGSDPVSAPDGKASTGAPLPPFGYGVQGNLQYEVGQALSMGGVKGEAWRGVVFSVSPQLPHGLDLITDTGAIKGTPKVPTPKTTYTITATRGDQKSSTTLTLTIVEKPAGTGHAMG